MHLTKAGAWPLAVHFVLRMSDLLAHLMDVRAVHVLHCKIPCKQEAVSILGALAAALQVGTAVQTGSLHAKRPVDTNRSSC